MRKIILSVAVAAMAFSTTASAFEDIKVSGQAKLWYESSDKGSVDLFDKDNSSGEIVFKLGMTGKQGNVGFGTTIYQSSSMGLNDELLVGNRTNTTDGDMFVGEAYVTAPMGSDTTLKLGKQELNTPYLFTEKWNALPNTFNAAVVTNKSVDNLTLAGMYVGQDNANTWKVDGDVNKDLFGGAFVVGALYKNSTFDANFWYTRISDVDAYDTIDAYWLDAGAKFANVDLRAYAAIVDSDGAGMEATNAYALSAGTKVGNFNLFAAASTVSDDNGHGPSNFSTGGKKTKLPTDGVYTDGVYVAQADSTAFKVKAATKIGATGVVLQVIDNSNDSVASKETTEVDLIITHKFGDFKTKTILMDRSFDDDAADSSSGAFHARFIVSLDF
ncbi:MAG: hypothetical protein C0628_09200 [Sulfurimonas sp.]|nr:MAG: hypothetical protein C0628_09200 [Sulfurimonas sp.]